MMNRDFGFIHDLLQAIQCLNHCEVCAPVGQRLPGYRCILHREDSPMAADAPLRLLLDEPRIHVWTLESTCPSTAELEQWYAKESPS
jgi:hypothetical protein